MASIVDTSVKHAYSSMTGAPTIGGTAGSLLAALDAFLVTGWGSKAVDSATISGGVCRLNFASGKSAAQEHAVILVAGASPSGINGEQKVTAVANGWVEFKTDLPDGAVTGSISFKMAPLGWEKVFSKTNVAVYRQTDIASTRTYYRVDDSDPLYSRVQMYESMTDVDSGIAVAPSVAGGYYWCKRAVAGGASYWVLAGDSRGVYFVAGTNSLSTAASTGNYACLSQYMGDLNSFRSGDAWSAMLTGAETRDYNNIRGCVFCSADAVGFTLKRRSTGLGTSVSCVRKLFGLVTAISGKDSTLSSFPSPVDNGLRLTEILITDGLDTNGPRGWMPGAYHCPQTGVIATMGANVLLTRGQGAFNAKQLLSVTIGPPASMDQGVAFLDVTGPWRV